jgi:hypothetical protein
MEMKIVRMVAAVVAATLAAGCAELKKADDWAMNKVLEDRGQVGQMQPEPWVGEMKVPEEAHCKFSAFYREDENCCIMPRYTTALDVDTAFAKARSEYDFQEKRPYGEGVNVAHYHGFLFEAHPAAFYRMMGEVMPRSDVRLSRGVWMALVVSKASATTTEIEAAYCEIRSRRMKDQLTWHRAMQDSVHATFPPVQPSQARK